MKRSGIPFHRCRGEVQREKFPSELPRVRHTDLSNDVQKKKKTLVSYVFLWYTYR